MPKLPKDCIMVASAIKIFVNPYCCGVKPPFIVNKYVFSKPIAKPMYTIPDEIMLCLRN